MSQLTSLSQQCQDALSFLHANDSIPRLINHFLTAMLVCNFFLFIGCFQAAMVPDIGLDTLLISCLLCFQNIMSMLILNNHRMPHSFHALAPSDFLLGATLGIAIGGSILSFVLSLFFGRMSRCPSADSEEERMSYYYTTALCDDHRGTMIGIWFWSGIVFWLDTAIAILIALGRDELTYMAQGNYETIGISLDEFENSFERYNTQLQHHGNNSDFAQIGEAVVTTSPSEGGSRKTRQERQDQSMDPLQ